MKKRNQAQRKADAPATATPVALNLSKGDSLDLTKTNPALDAVAFACGWDTPNLPAGSKFDIDLSMIMLGANGKLYKGSSDSIIFFNNLKSKDGSIAHTGDNLTGEGDGDDETVNIDLKKIPADCDQVVGVLNLFQAAQRNQQFGQVANAFARVYNRSDKAELGRYTVSGENGKTSLIIGRLHRKDGGWSFEATGEYGTAKDLTELVSRYQ